MLFIVLSSNMIIIIVIDHRITHIDLYCKFTRLPHICVTACKSRVIVLFWTSDYMEGSALLNHYLDNVEEAKTRDVFLHG